jgi:hypothetical protein
MIIKIGQEPTEREPGGPDSLTEGEPKFAMIASPTTDDCKPLQIALTVRLLAAGRLLAPRRLRR